MSVSLMLLYFSTVCVYTRADDALAPKANTDAVQDEAYAYTLEDIILSLDKFGINYTSLLNEYRKICPSLYKQCRPCSCNQWCWVNGGCCPDCPYTFIKQGCVNVAVMGESDSRQMIDECPIYFNGDTELKVLCSSNMSYISPVSYEELPFKNKYCAECHGVKFYVPWSLLFECEKRIPDDLRIDNTLEETLSNCGCVASFVYPEYRDRKVPCRRAEDRIGQCNVTGLWEEADPGLKWACEELDNLPHYGKIFKNVYCYLCNPSIASTRKHPQVQSCNLNVVCKSEPTFSKRLFPYGSECLMRCNGVGEGIKMLNLLSKDSVDVFTTETVNHQTGHSMIQIDLTVSRISDIFGSIRKLISEISDKYFVKSDVSKEANEIQSDVKSAYLKEQLSTYTAICGNALVCKKDLVSLLNADVHGNWSEIREIKSYTVFCLSYKLCYLPSNYYQRIIKQIDVNPMCNADCSCDSSCLQSGTCCVEVLLEKEPFSCYDAADFLTLYLNGKNDFINKVQTDTSTADTLRYSVVSKCIDESETSFRNKCGDSGDSTDILTKIPVEYGDLLYKNIYCLLCNSKNITEQLLIRMSLECDSYMETDLFEDLRSMLQEANNHCMIKFSPTSKHRCRKKTTTGTLDTFYTRETNISFDPSELKYFWKCNETGKWAGADMYIQRICEEDSETFLYLPEYRIESKVYKNFACFECNPEVSTDEINKTGTIGYCTDTQLDRNEMLQTLCLETPLHERWFPYKNFFCAECNLQPIQMMNIIYQFTPSLNTTASNREFLGKYSHREIFSLVPAARTSAPADVTTCAGIYDSVKQICRRLQCGGDRVLVNDTCRTVVPVVPAYRTAAEPELSVDSYFGVFKYLMRIRVRLEDVRTIDKTEVVLLETLCSDLLSSSWENTSLQISSIVGKCTIYNASCETAYVTLGNLSDLILSYTIHTIHNLEEYDESVEEILVDGLKGSYVIEATSRLKVSLTSSPVSQKYRPHENISKCSFEWNKHPSKEIIYVDKFLTCPQYHFNESDVDFDSNTDSATLYHDGTTLTGDDFKLVNSSFIVCKEDYNRTKHREPVGFQKSAYTTAFRIFNSVCIIMSLVCLFITFITLSIFKTLRNIPGKNIMTLTLTLFVAHLLIQIAPFVQSNVLNCAIFGATMHYFWLSTFCAMCACSFHMFRIFYIGYLSPPKHDRGANYTVAKYNTFVFGVPFGIVSISITCHMIATAGHFAGYRQQGLCFLDGLYSILFAFILPSLLLTITSIVLFSMSFHRIRTAPHMRGDRDRHDVLIYIKLCTIVGITWPLQVVDGIFQFSFLSFIVVGLNALQGVFIFVAYICNARVLRLYKTLICNDQAHSSSSESRPSKPVTEGTKL